ncbi:hypothetical protein N8198_00465 [Gammaproteobacteria bacterium]|nr:hypothetical protein [Gammaproteobacteria bacterium]
MRRIRVTDCPDDGIGRLGRRKITLQFGATRATYDVAVKRCDLTALQDRFDMTAYAYIVARQKVIAGGDQ